MTRQPPAVRSQAERSNALWHFDMSPSDLKHLKAPPWLDPDRAGAPTLMLFSVVDDRSGVAYQEYRCVYGEDVEAALRFLFNAMSPKPAAADGEADPFQGIPATIYLDNGPVAKSAVFKRVMESLGAEVMTHMPAESDGAAHHGALQGQGRAPVPDGQGGARDPLPLPPAADRGGGEPVARPVHHRLQRARPPVRAALAHRRLAGAPAGGRRAADVRLGAVLRLCPRAGAAPGRRGLPRDGRRRGLRGGRRAGRRDGRALVGPVRPGTVGRARRGALRAVPAVGGPVPLHRYRKHRKSRREVRADQVGVLAGKLALPRAALSGEDGVVMVGAGPDAKAAKVPVRPFRDPDPFRELGFANPIAAGARSPTRSGCRWPSCRMTTGPS